MIGPVTQLNSLFIMKQHILTSILLPCLAVSLLAVGCRKEKALEPSKLDEDYFVIKDNPADPVDHARYQFYTSTGIASYYNDTIHRYRLADLGAEPRFAYVTLSLGYTVFDAAAITFKPLSNKEKVPAILDLLKENVHPVLPENISVPSILLVDTFATSLSLRGVETAHGWTSIWGFNTIGITVLDVAAMTSEEQKMYGASILAGIAEKQLNKVAAAQLQKDFFSISRAVPSIFKTMGFDIYMGLPLSFLPPASIPAPRSVGLLRYIVYGLANPPNSPTYTTLPRESDDIRAYLTAVFYYTTAEFTAIYGSDALIMNKFNIIKNIAKDAGFKVPE